jgi:histidinol phosphatase-like PHP family hydrolase
LEKYPQSKSKIDKDLDRLMPLQLNGIKKNPNSILAHILNFPLSIKYLPLKMFDMADKILEQLQESNVALEIHASHIKGYRLDTNIAEKQRIAGEITLPEFYRYLYHRARNFSIKFALGSDAHNLAHILNKNEWISFLSSVGIHESQLITPDFFNNT